MVRNILSGLLIAGVAPVIVVDVTAIEHSSKVFLETTVENTPDNFDLLCTVPSFWTVCNSSSAVKPKEISSDFNLPSLARLLRSRSISLCAERSPEQVWQSQKNQLNSSLYKSKCVFPWQSKFSQKSLLKRNPTILSRRNSQDLTKSNTPDVSKISQFPKLSRSSLIVSLPQHSESSELKPEKLANPAPANQRIASPFGWRSRPFSNQLQFHQGIDYGAPLGSPVVAVGNGIVTKVSSGCVDFGNLFCGGQLGNWIEIDHGNGAIATYGHLQNSSIAIKQGMKVKKNQQIAQVGSSGWSTGAHLDFRLKINGEYENPAKYVIDTSKTKI